MRVKARTDRSLDSLSGELVRPSTGNRAKPLRRVSAHVDG